MEIETEEPVKQPETDSESVEIHDQNQVQANNVPNPLLVNQTSEMTSEPSQVNVTMDESRRTAVNIVVAKVLNDPGEFSFHSLLIIYNNTTLCSTRCYD